MPRVGQRVMQNLLGMMVVVVRIAELLLMCVAAAGGGEGTLGGKGGKVEVV